ncbi:MAG: hypothetical protein KAH84_08510 [Thiomargarita sp.]|nr:hypothetical protein [Thiomargarita sp.]
MQTITLHSHVGADSMLHLQVPPDFVNTDIKITMEVQKKRTVGEYIGKIQISDDFDAPLPDEFWLGKIDK